MGMSNVIQTKVAPCLRAEVAETVNRSWKLNNLGLIPHGATVVSCPYRLYCPISLLITEKRWPFHRGITWSERDVDCSFNVVPT